MSKDSSSQGSPLTIGASPTWRGGLPPKVPRACIASSQSAIDITGPTRPVRALLRNQPCSAAAEMTPADFGVDFAQELHPQNAWHDNLLP